MATLRQLLRGSGAGGNMSAGAPLSPARYNSLGGGFGGLEPPLSPAGSMDLSHFLGGGNMGGGNTVGSPMRFSAAASLQSPHRGGAGGGGAHGHGHVPDAAMCRVMMGAFAAAAEPDVCLELFNRWGVRYV